MKITSKMTRDYKLDIDQATLESIAPDFDSVTDRLKKCFELGDCNKILEVTTNAIKRWSMRTQNAVYICDAAILLTKQFSREFAKLCCGLKRDNSNHNNVVVSIDLTSYGHTDTVSFILENRYFM